MLRALPLLRKRILPAFRTRIRLYSDDSLKEKLLSTRGKKKMPEKQKIVVLNPGQVTSFKRRRRGPVTDHANTHTTTDSLITRHNRPISAPRTKLSILEGVDLGISTNGSKEEDKEKLTDTVLEEIDQKRRKLMVFRSTVSEEQAVKAIGYQKPVKPIMSQKRYEQLENLLKSAYTVNQLRAYSKKMFGPSLFKKSKAFIIKKIMNEYWQCQVDENINEKDDLIIERELDIKTRDTYLLLLTDNGKILHNLARIGAILAVAPEENKIIIRASANVIRYVEISLNRILENVKTEIVPIEKLIRDHSIDGKLDGDMNVEQIIDLVQKQASVYIDLISDSSEEKQYNISAFGKKRIDTAKLYLTWASKYTPHVQEEYITTGDKCMKEKCKEYPYTDMDSFNWLDKNKLWYRLQLPENKLLGKTDKLEYPPTIEMLDVKRIYDFLTDKNISLKQKLLPVKGTRQHVISVTMGQLLKAGNSMIRTFLPRIPTISNFLMDLPYFEETHEGNLSVLGENDDYYVQLKFKPDLSSIPPGIKSYPPNMELWFELDDRDNAIKASMDCIFSVSEKAVMLEAPQHPFDFKIVSDAVVSLNPSLENDDPGQWLEGQDELKHYVDQAKLDFGQGNKMLLGNSVCVNIPTEEEGTVQVRYDFVNTYRHRITRLKFRDRFLVQYSNINGGARGGQTNRIDLICDDNPDYNDFSNFIQQSLEFGKKKI
ncbi:uncharacterized protein CGFF_00495 [Nakaseomyces glabratus]|nr:Mitochondrial inner-membrane-bound regulator [Nakaseomyces glabratus]KAH7592654.1 Mitochondrial inner-membrane-bound regulator [Nakaseomyces glabratus]KAH7610499.1 Mitochondrial inner-membrane-bound regulator [Nakaseomyces glabratus]KAI8381812.1 Mitochondrial inner-membrane-bound regulator [Nakaseomyces glabratus]KAI8392042.1 Mitochondrial inner-membrane-bound regulator [Nakaseomyces glabratus]